MAKRWERLAEDIRQRIRSGELQAGDRLPTYRELERQSGWSYATVRYALTVLSAEGWISGEQGVGVFVRQDHPE